MTGGVKVLMSCNPLSEARMSVLCFQNVRFRDNSRTSLWNFATWCLLVFCRFPLSRFIMHSQRNRMNTFGQDWRNWFLHLWEKDWNTWRVHRPKILTVSAGPGYKILRKYIRCLYNYVNNCLCVATNQSTYDQREQTLHFDTSQLVLNQVPNVC